MALNRTQCCGIREYAGLWGTAPQIIKRMAQELRGSMSGAIITFSDRIDTPQKGVGYRIKNYIHKHELGTVIATEPTKNPNTGSMIVLWAWTVNHENLKKWYKKGVKK